MPDIFVKLIVINPAFAVDGTYRADETPFAGKLTNFTQKDTVILLVLLENCW